jgi:TorA maturation chaperone TorD
MSAFYDDPLDDVLARAVVYRALSVGFQAPTDVRLSFVGARNGFPTLAAALLHLNAREGPPDALERAASALTGLTPEAIAAADASFWRLFGHTTRGRVCPCETEYGRDDGFHQPQQLADVSGYYLAFGLRFGADSDIRADHIACECEFMDFLSRKEAWLAAGPAHDNAAEESLETTRQAGRTFLRDHLASFGCAFGARVAAEDPGGYYDAFGRVLLAFLQCECRRVAVRAGALDLTARSADIDDDTPMACGSADELIQIQRRP